MNSITQAIASWQKLPKKNIRVDVFPLLSLMDNTTERLTSKHFNNQLARS